MTSERIEEALAWADSQPRDWWRVKALAAAFRQRQEALDLLVDAIENGDGLSVVTALEHARSLASEAGTKA